MPSSRPLTLVVLTFALLAAGCDRESGQAAQPAPSASASAAKAEPAKGAIDRTHKGSALPELTLKDGAGHEFRLAQLKGKPALINLWATWCAPCVAELPTLDKLSEQRADLTVLAVSQDMGDPAKVAQFWTKHGYQNLKPWLDGESELSFHYNTGTLPTTILYDAQGREVWRYVGERDWGSPDTAKLLAEAFPA